LAGSTVLGGNGAGKTCVITFLADEPTVNKLVVFTGCLTSVVHDKDKVFDTGCAVCEGALAGLAVLVALIAVCSILNVSVRRAEVKTFLGFKRKNFGGFTAGTSINRV